MHMADALLSPAVGATFWAGTLGAIAYCSKKLKEKMDDRLVPLMGVLGAFIFAGQMINFTIPGTGSSGHIGGGMMLAIILGPYAAFLAIASVLTVQSLFFADGGILALGCNIWNLGVYPCFIAYPLIYRPLVKINGSKKIFIASILSVVLGLQLGAFSVVAQTLFSGKSELPFITFLYMMLPIHLAIGLAEGFITAGVVNYVWKIRPDILGNASVSKSIPNGGSVRKVLISFLLIAIFTGGVFSWFASSRPDGLEWAIKRTYGSPELPEQEKGIPQTLKEIQEKTSFLPDYNLKQNDSEIAANAEEKWPVINPWTSISGILGASIVLFLIFGIGMGIRVMKRKKA